MDSGSLIELMRMGIVTVLIVASPVLLVSMGVGLIVSIFQATTSIQDQTLTFVPKILAIFMVIAIFSGWMAARMAGFTIIVFERVRDLAG